MALSKNIEKLLPTTLRNVIHETKLPALFTLMIFLQAVVLCIFCAFLLVFLVENGQLIIETKYHNSGTSHQLVENNSLLLTGLFCLAMLRTPLSWLKFMSADPKMFFEPDNANLFSFSPWSWLLTWGAYGGIFLSLLAGGFQMDTIFGSREIPMTCALAMVISYLASSGCLFVLLYYKDVVRQEGR